MQEENKLCPENLQGCVHRLMKVVAFVLVVLALFLLAKTYGAFKENKFIGQDVYPQNTIRVTGEGEVSVVPDIATFSFSITEEAKTVEKAQKDATEKMSAVLDYLEKAEINEKDIKTTGYNIYPRYEWWTKEIQCFAYPCPQPDRERELVAYEVSQNVTIKLTDIDKAGEVLSGIGSIGVSNVSGLSFDVDEKDELLRGVRQEAIEKAQIKAKELAKDLDVKLVRMISYSSGEDDRVYPVYDSGMMAFGKSGGAEIENVEIPVGENEIKVTVYLTYEIK